MKEVVNIQSASKKYIQQAVQIVFALFLLELLILQILGAGLLLTPVLVSMCFALIVELSDAFIWKRLENKTEETKATFFMAVSGFRFLLALLMLFVYYFMSDRSGMIAFILLFAPYYLAVLVHHSIFFSHLRSKS
ncbi:hypothetical protein [Segatella maculosa]|jgi:hypothetical protein|uniref:hypothetical protein n=1 Tax=Segatella maculosa TaxID=439703 RepID=UPI0024911113|nr:hypothetical protein [Segatella maculosa]